MRIMLAVGVLCLLTGAASAANDGPWCYRDFGGPQYTNCNFPTARQCLAIAGTVGGICERNRAPLPAQTKAKARRAS